MSDLEQLIEIVAACYVGMFLGVVIAHLARAR